MFNKQSEFGVATGSTYNSTDTVPLTRNGTNGVRWCFHESEAALLVGLALFAEILRPCEILCKICIRLHERRTSPPKQDLTALGGLEFSL